MSRRNKKIERLVGWVAIALTLLVPGLGMAEGRGIMGSAALELDSRIYATLMGSGVETDDARELDERATGLLLGVGWQVNEQFGVEGLLQKDEYAGQDGTDGSDAVLQSLGLRALVYPSKGNLYGYLGLGYGEFEPEGSGIDSYESVLWSLGAGYVTGPLSLGVFDLMLRAEIGFRADMHSGSTETPERNNSFNEATAQLGLVVPFGVPPEAPAESDANGVNVVPVSDNPDLDGDGVENLMDACPGTPSGAAVDVMGCSG